MPPDEALGLAQILLGLLLFTVGIPALIIEVRVEEPLRRVLHKRIRPGPMIALGACSLSADIVLILVSSAPVPVLVQTLLKGVAGILICLFAWSWVYIYKNVRIELVIRNVVSDLHRQIHEKGSAADPDLADLLLFGEHLAGGEKNTVIKEVERLCQAIQNVPRYSGTQLEELVRGLQRIVSRNGTLEHHRSAHTVVRKCWNVLVQRGLTGDQDARVLKEVAAVLGALAVSQHMEATALRWMSTIPGVVDVPHRIGAAAVHVGHFPVAIEALDRLSRIAAAQRALPKEFIALAAHFTAAGPSAARTAQEFTARLGYSLEAIRAAAENAAAEFRETGDYTTADAIEAVLAQYAR